MKLITKVKEYLAKEKSYDFLSEYWTDEILCYLYDAIEATEQILFPKNDSKLPISEVVFFELKGNKYLASNGQEITTEMLLQHEHTLFNDEGYIILKQR